MEEKKITTTLKKNQKAKIETKNGNSYSYQYVDISQIHDYLESINARYIQQTKRIDGDDYIMTKRCFAGVWEDEWLQGSKVVDATLFGTDNPAQKQGSALTYARRYSLLMAFGLATEDNNAQDLNNVKIELTLKEAESYANEYTFKKGNHAGMTLLEVIDDQDDRFIDWLLNNSKDKKLLKAIELLTGQVKLSPEESKDNLNLLAEFEDLIIKSDTDRESIYEHYKVKSSSQLNIEQLKEAIKIMKAKVK